MLLPDELTAEVDQPGQERLDTTLDRLRRDEGVTVRLISHDVSVVYRYATHVLCLTREHRNFAEPHGRTRAALPLRAPHGIAADHSAGLLAAGIFIAAVIIASVRRWIASFTSRHAARC